MKNEKKVEKKVKKDRKVQQRLLEMQMAKELKKPVEDMKLGQESKVRRIIITSSFIVHFTISTNEPWSYIVLM